MRPEIPAPEKAAGLCLNMENDREPPDRVMACFAALMWYAVFPCESLNAQGCAVTSKTVQDDRRPITAAQIRSK